MIHDEQEYRTTLQRIAHFQEQVGRLRETETNPENYRLSAGGFLAELDRMNLEVREYLWSHPSQLGPSEGAAQGSPGAQFHQESE